MNASQVGVNGYAFIVTNNGHVLIHPDLRPVFENILKPAYNSVDMAELELMDDDREPRQFDANLIEVSVSFMLSSVNIQLLNLCPHSRCEIQS